MKRALHALLASVLCIHGCDRHEQPAPNEPTAESSSVSSATTDAPPAAPPARTRAGSTIAISESADVLWVAEEDRSVLWRVGLPLDASRKPERVDLPGPPAQVLPLAERVLVTIREPSMLLVLDARAAKVGVAEVGRIPLPDDAWGVAVTGDSRTAVVTTAWTRQVAIIDLPTLSQRASVRVAREPRGIVIPKASGAPAYITHLVGSELTRIDHLEEGVPSVTRIALPPAPSRSPAPSQASASLTYGAALSADERKLYAPRHALGVVAEWYGAATVDVLAIPEDTPWAPPRSGTPARTVADFVPTTRDKNSPGTIYAPTREVDRDGGPVPFLKRNAFHQPRAVVYRTSTNTLLVASEGSDAVVELDASFLEPALGSVKIHDTGRDYLQPEHVAERGGAPSGIALSADEQIAYVFCRTTSDVVALPLGAGSPANEPVFVRLGDDPLLEGVTGDKRPVHELAALGRRLYFSARDTFLSDGAHPSAGAACAGCHPDGRDDGHVWLEVDATRHNGPLPRLLDGPPLLAELQKRPEAVGPSYAASFPSHGRARQTPMLAGRVDFAGPFGWRGESETLEARIHHGARLHRWGASPHAKQFPRPTQHARALAAFLRVGLRPPRRGSPSPIAARGKELFESEAVGCSACHVAQRSARLTDGGVVRQSAHVDESATAFRTPPLAFVGGTPPYFHDGSAEDLDTLIANNQDRMGRTTQLSDEDRAALVAYLKTL